MSSPKRLRAAARVSETRRGRASGYQHGSVVSSHVVDRYDNPQRIKDIDDAGDATYDEQGSGHSREQLHSSRRVASRDACPFLPSGPRGLEPLHAAHVLGERVARVARAAVATLSGAANPDRVAAQLGVRCSLCRWWMGSGCNSRNTACRTREPRERARRRHARVQQRGHCDGGEAATRQPARVASERRVALSLSERLQPAWKLLALGTRAPPALELGTAQHL